LARRPRSSVAKGATLDIGFEEIFMDRVGELSHHPVFGWYDQ